MEIITKETIEYRNLFAELRGAMQIMDKILNEVTPPMCGERYLTAEQVMAYLHISRRTLQSYRDKGIISYVTIGGNILYPESKICKVLEQNYYSPEK